MSKQMSAKNQVDLLMADFSFSVRTDWYVPRPWKVLQKIGPILPDDQGLCITLGIVNMPIGRGTHGADSICTGAGSMLTRASAICTRASSILTGLPGPCRLPAPPLG
jgi:hypothetical protein